MVDIREYRDPGGHSPFGEWRSRLDTPARQKVTIALYRVGLGNFSNVRGIGSGVFEYKINFGPGYRLYFGKEGEEIVILLGGGTKQRQENDIAHAISRWANYKERKKGRERKGMTMALTTDFRETVQADIKRDPEFRRGILSEALESLLGGEVPLAKELLRDYINATVGFPKLAAHTKFHVKTIHQMFGPKGNPTAKNLFEIVAYLQQAEGVRFEVRPIRAPRRSKKRATPPRTKRSSATMNR